VTTDGPSPAYSAELGVSHLERVEALFFTKALYTITDGLFVRDPTKGGRPQVHPDYFVVAFGCLADIYDGSARAASTALDGPLVWKRIREIVEQVCPDDQSKWLPKDPPDRSWYVKRKNRIDADVLEELRTRFIRSAVDIADELGLLDPNGPGTPTHPESTRMIYHDGKAIRQMYNGAPGDTREVNIVDPRHRRGTRRGATRACGPRREGPHHGGQATNTRLQVLARRSTA
jgi:hypothetical protein